VTAITEYGVRRAHPVTGAERIQWPTPGTGLLALPGGTVDGDDLEAIRRAIATQPALEGASVVSRSYEIEEVAAPEPALPTTPGSVIRATTTYDGTILLVRSDHSPGEWLGWNTTLSEPDSWSGDYLTDVEILFDAGTAP